MIYDEITEVVIQAGEIIKKAHAEDDAVFQKEGDTNFVTKYDKQVQAFLIEHFRKMIPGVHFLAEEDGIQQELGDEYCFIIDPIDGTTNFICDYRFSCVSVGLAYKGKMQFGAVYNPYTDDLYTAVRGEGARLNGKRIHCSTKGLATNIGAFGCARYNSDETDRIFDYAKKLYLNCLAVRSGGSAALDICRVASGANGVYIELMLHPWDYAAASLILTEAGGFISTVDGKMITLDKPCSILAAGRTCWKEMMKIL